VRSSYKQQRSIGFTPPTILVSRFHHGRKLEPTTLSGGKKLAPKEREEKRERQIEKKRMRKKRKKRAMFSRQHGSLVAQL